MRRVGQRFIIGHPTCATDSGCHSRHTTNKHDVAGCHVHGKTVKDSRHMVNYTTSFNCGDDKLLSGGSYWHHFSCVTFVTIQYIIMECN